MGDLIFNGGNMRQCYMVCFSDTPQENLASGVETNSERTSSVDIVIAYLSCRRFTVRNITINNAQTGIYSTWNWGLFSSACVGAFLKLIFDT